MRYHARMSTFRRLLVLLLCLVPLITLVHRSELNAARWDFNRCLMASPDEPSYLLMAKALATGGGGHGINTLAIAGRDTFYPPGYPALLAAWGKVFGFSIFSMHVCTTLLLCAAAGVAYVLMKRLLANSEFRILNSEFVPLVILALFVFNWHVLEGAIFIFSEPAYMLVTFTWLLAGLKWRTWYLCWRQTLILALLAAAAMSIRGAGVVCFGVMLVQPALALLSHLRRRSPQPQITKRLACVAIVLAVAVAYQVGIACVSPEKSFAAGADSANSYSKQLLHGLTDGGRLSYMHPADWHNLAVLLRNLIARHIDDFSEVFVPWLIREYPGPGLLNPIGKFILLFGLAGWLWRIIGREKRQAENTKEEDLAGSRTQFVELYILLYIALYMIWPFNMPRFWAPILPIMLAYAAIALCEFGTRFSPQSHRDTEASQRSSTKESHLCASSSSLCLCGEKSPRVFLFSIFYFLLFALLLVLHIEEVTLQLGNYQRRLNYVSDSVADAVAAIVKRSPDPAETTVCVRGGDEHFLYAWYLSAAGSSLPLSPAPNARRDDRGNPRDEFVSRLLLRQIANLQRDPARHLFIVSYFTHGDMQADFETLNKEHPEIMSHVAVRKIYQKGIESAVWEIAPIHSPAQPLP